MTVIMWILFGLFCLKIGWNLRSPYILAINLLKGEASKLKGVSMATTFEVVLWLLSIAASAISNGTSFLHNTKQVALWGGYCNRWLLPPLANY
jgi:hypothetical protein